MANDYYKLLNVSRQATESEIKEAYRQQSKVWRTRLNAPDFNRRQEAERMLVELASARKVLLNSKKYDFDKPRKPKKKRNRQNFSPLEVIKIGFKIVVNGFGSAARHILKIIGTIAWQIGKIILRILIIAFIACQLAIGIGGLITFVTGIYEEVLDLALKGMVCNYFSMSTIAFIAYFWDKRKARLNLWRTPEAQLHYLELGGGWIGAFLAQVFLRHKSSKASFQLVYWLIVFFHFSLFLFFIPKSFSYAIPHKYILMINAFLLIISLNAIKNKGHS